MAIEQVRTFLFIALLFVAFLLWQAWQQDYGKRAEPPPDTMTGQPVTAETVPGAPGVKVRPDVPDVPTVSTEERPTDVSVPQIQQGPKPQRIQVRTDVFAAEISLQGGDLRQVDLVGYPVSLKEPDVPFSLLRDTSPNFFIAQSGLLGPRAAPNHHANFSVDRTAFVLGQDDDQLDVRLRWTEVPGINVTKVYTFRRGSYLVDVAFEIENTTQEAWSGRAYGQLQRTEPAEKRRFIYTYTGGVLSSEEKPYEKIDFGDMSKQKLDRTVKGGWAAMIQHYFAGAWIPDQTTTNHYYTKALQGGRYVIGVITPEVTVGPGESGKLSLQTYVGPKIQTRLEKAAPHLNRTVDYGWLWIIALPLFLLLKFIHGVIGNWGWSIVILTILIKLAFFQLSATSYKSMARMRKLQPRLVSLRERYGSDKARMNQAMMELYKKEKVNPLGGCLPIAVQIPVFIALYWVLLESVELRQADFIFWLNDLSTYDPFFVLPILMGITMLLQQRLNPTPPDPIQAKVMMALPFVFTFFFLFFPSGLVLYWFVNNVLSIAQQWVITKRIAPETT